MPFADISVEDRSFSPNNEDYRRYFKFNINWRLDEKIYLSDTDFFINGVSSGNFRQSSTHIKLTSPQSMVNEENFLYRNFSTNFTLGVGYGRLRGVNPMMRALRLNERLNTLDTGQALSNTDLFYAAEQFAKFNGYQQAYDRPDKHFWGDMDNLLSANFASLDTFDMLYLTDTTAEPLGFRREGWQILASAGILYSIQYDPSENDDDTQTNRNSYLTPGISGSWFKNLSLKHQIGLQGSYQFLAVIGSSPGSDINFINSSANWIFTITDRILTNTTAGYTRRSRANMVTNTISIDADINYFIENRFSLFTNFRFMKNSTDVDTVPGMHLVAIDDQMFIFNAGIRYFMRRSLH